MKTHFIKHFLFLFLGFCNTVFSFAQSHSKNFHTTPVDHGVEKGVIEIGASGFNAFAANIDKKGDWEIKYKQFGASYAAEGALNLDTVEKKLDEYIQILEEKGVRPENIHFVVSSGAMKMHNAQFISQALTQKGYIVHPISATDEGKFAFEASLPSFYRAQSFCVDLGSGNTKISYLENGKIHSIECEGAKYYLKNISDSTVEKNVKNAMAQVPNNKRQYCVIIGGVPFQLAKSVRKNRERFTYLNDAIKNAKEDSPKMHSGLTIIHAIVNNTGEDTEYTFDWDASFAIGFLLHLQQ